MPTPSLRSHLSMKTQDPLSIQPLPKRDVDFLYPSQFYMSPFLSIFLSPPGMGLQYHCVALNVRKSGPDNGLSKRTSAKSFTLPIGLWRLKLAEPDGNSV